MSSQYTYQKSTTYAFSLESQFNKSAKLGLGETIIYKTKISLYSQFIFARLGYFVLTNKRLFLSSTNY